MEHTRDMTLSKVFRHHAKIKWQESDRFVARFQFAYLRVLFARFSFTMDSSKNRVKEIPQILHKKLWWFGKISFFKDFIMSARTYSWIPAGKISFINFLKILWEHVNMGWKFQGALKSISPSSLFSVRWWWERRWRWS